MILPPHVHVWPLALTFLLRPLLGPHEIGVVDPVDDFFLLLDGLHGDEEELIVPDNGGHVSSTPGGRRT